MRVAACPICGGVLAPAFEAVVLGRHRARYEHCPGCGFLRVRDPHWLGEAYSSAIAATDTGLVMRNIENARRLASVLCFGMGERGNGRYLDAAGGHGLLTRLMRDAGFDFRWSDKYCENLLARGFEFRPEHAPCAAVTAFEVLEHVEDPVRLVAEALTLTASDTFIFTTELYAGEPPLPGQWWYYALETGQHIAFYQERTLGTLAARLGMRLFSTPRLHVLSKRSLSRLWLSLCGGGASHLLAPLARSRLGGKAHADREQIVREIEP
jgi:hypothetical protein